MADETDIVQASIVMVGKFNPAIFSPAWLAKCGIITDDEMNAAEVEVVHRQVTRFTIEHLSFAVDLNKFSVAMTSEPIIKLADYVLQIFGNLLPHTPVTSVGINYSEHWRLDSWQRRVALGRALAPPQPWGEWSKSWKSDDVETVGGVVQLVLLEKYAEESGFRRVEIGPSPDLADKARGVYLSVNHHRELKTDDGDGAEAAIKTVADEFDTAVADARRILTGIREFAQSLEVQ